MGAVWKAILSELGLTKLIRSISKIFASSEGTITMPTIREIEDKIINDINKNIRKPFRNRRAIAQKLNIKKKRVEIMKSELVFFDSWITTARKQFGKDHWDLKMGGKWYSFPNLKDFLVSRMRMSKYVGKLLWNTLWLHKRKWTTGTKKPKPLFKQDLEKRDYKQLQKYILKHQKVPRGYNHAVQSSAKWGRLTTPFTNLLDNTIWK